MKNAIILISGNGSNAQSIIKESKIGILKDKLKINYVISNNKSAKGLEKAKKLNIKTFVIENKNLTRKKHEKLIIELIKKENINVDLIILAGYMRILSFSFISLYKDKIINIHPADTKKHQGLNGYEWAYNTKLDYTKITVHFVDQGLDTGKIIAQKTINIKNLTLKEIIRKGQNIENNFYPNVIKKLIESLN